MMIRFFKKWSFSNKEANYGWEEGYEAYLQSGGGHTNDGLQLGLVEDECNTVISKCIVDGDQGELIGVTTVLCDAPLDAVLAENTNALVLLTWMEKKIKYTKFLMNQVLLN